ncbi:MAG: SoxR reducing system RseC family protein [Agarilytica sp.]
MLKETGTVVAVDEDGVWVETLQQSTCAKCSAKQGCGQQLLNKLSPSHNMTFIKALYTDASKRHIWVNGDTAVLGVNENALVFAALLAYGLPILLMMLGIGVGGYWSGTLSNDLHTVFGALVGLIIGGVIVKLHGLFIRDDSVFQAYVLDKSIGEPHA